MTEQITDQLGASAVIVFIMQWLKGRSWFPWLTEKTDTLNRWLAVGLSGLAALGIHMTFDQAAGTLTITGINAAAILAAAWVWLKSYAVQETMYRVVKAKTVVAPREVWTDEMREAAKPQGG